MSARPWRLYITDEIKHRVGVLFEDRASAQRLEDQDITLAQLQTSADAASTIRCGDASKAVFVYKVREVVRAKTSYTRAAASASRRCRAPAARMSLAEPDYKVRWGFPVQKTRGHDTRRAQGGARCVVQGPRFSWDADRRAYRDKCDSADCVWQTTVVKHSHASGPRPALPDRS